MTDTFTLDIYEYGDDPEYPDESLWLGILRHGDTVITLTRSYRIELIDAAQGIAAEYVSGELEPYSYSAFRDSMEIIVESRASSDSA